MADLQKAYTQDEYVARWLLNVQQEDAVAEETKKRAYETFQEEEDSDIVHDPVHRNFEHKTKEDDDPSKKYTRRPRHKTKTNKYEYKGEVTKPEKRKDKKHKPKHSRRKKTGVSLSNEFKAPNVEQERLTLRDATGQGIFGNGKASAPVPRRGLPDLTFSEMNFLNKRRLADHAGVPSRTEQKPSKKKDKRDDISEFFSRPAAEIPDLRYASSEANNYKRRSGHTELDRSLVRSLPANIPIRNRPRETSQCDHSLQSRPVRRKHKWNLIETRTTDEEISPVQHSQSAQLDRVYMSSHRDRSASYYSWSTTPTPEPLPQSGLEPGQQKIDDTRETADARLKDEQQTHHSPLSNSSLDRYTKHVLLGADHQLWNAAYKSEEYKSTFSLDDLKGLARLGEINAKYEKIPTQVHEVGHEICQGLEDVGNLKVGPSTRVSFDAQGQPSMLPTENMKTDRQQCWHFDLLKPDAVISNNPRGISRLPAMISSSPHADVNHRIPKMPSLEANRARWVLKGDYCRPNVPLYHETTKFMLQSEREPIISEEQMHEPRLIGPAFSRPSEPLHTGSAIYRPYPSYDEILQHFPNSEPQYYCKNTHHEGGFDKPDFEMESACRNQHHERTQWTEESNNIEDDPLPNEQQWGMQVNASTLENETRETDIADEPQNESHPWATGHFDNASQRNAHSDQQMTDSNRRNLGEEREKSLRRLGGPSFVNIYHPVQEERFQGFSRPNFLH